MLITMGNIKQKPFRQIWAYSYISRHIQPYAGICRQTYSGIFRTLCNLDIFRTLVYSEPWQLQNQWHIQNLGIFKTLASWEPEAYSQPWYIQNPFLIRTLASSEPEAYSELWYIQNARIIRTLERFVKIVNILYEINIMNFLIQV